MDRGIEDHCISMAALGRCFELGDFYNYRNDQIIKDYSEEGNIVRDELYQCQNVFERELMYTGHSDTSSTRNHKWEELDEHLQVSIVTGLIENEYRGASNYLNDRPDKQQITWTILFRAKTRKEMFKRLPVEWLIDPSNDDNVNNKENSDATHIVAGIVYGAEAYCVLSWELNGEEEDQDVREEARESLWPIWPTN
uniref:Uncharacterized protein n=1 Tax=Daphnia galeata TaxID=27404 RepID=A0A8J2RUB6_9CRUS|nr:unnamed protein product [Daphnia galeata]